MNAGTEAMQLSRTIAVSVHGAPSTKGSMKCIGQVGKVKHVLVEQLGPAVKKWRRIVEPAGDKLRELAGGPLDRPIGIELFFTLERPATVPLWKRWWPFTRGSGDVDKLVRCVLDALTVPRKHPERGVLADDAIVCELFTRKTYPDTPDVSDRLTRPGVVIRLYPLPDQPPPAELPYERVLDQDERTGA